MRDETNTTPPLEPELGMLEQSLSAWEMAIDARWRRIEERAARVGRGAPETSEAASLVQAAEQRAHGARELRRVMLEKRRSNARMLDGHASEVELLLERARHKRAAAIARPVDPPPPAPPPPPPPPPAAVPAESPVEAAKATAIGIERRGHRRTRLEVDVTLSSEHNFFVGFAENISEGGLFIATHKLLPMGAPLELTFRLPTGGPIEVHCVVRWIREYNQMSDTPPGMGVEFVGLSEADREAVLEFLRQRDPLFYA